MTRLPFDAEDEHEHEDEYDKDHMISSSSSYSKTQTSKHAKSATRNAKGQQPEASRDQGSEIRCKASGLWQLAAG